MHDGLKSTAPTVRNRETRKQAGISKSDTRKPRNKSDVPDKNIALQTSVRMPPLPGDSLNHPYDRRDFPHRSNSCPAQSRGPNKYDAPPSRPLAGARSRVRIAASLRWDSELRVGGRIGRFLSIHVSNRRLLHYALYFLIGIGIGAYGIWHGLLAADGKLARRWFIWGFRMAR
jgi:hypothetical protein